MTEAAPRRSRAERLHDLLHDARAEGGFDVCLVATDQGLVVSAAHGEGAELEALGAMSSLYESIVRIARADIGLDQISEVTVRDEGRGRIVVRPVGDADGVQLYLVVQLPRKRTWRRITSALGRSLRDAMAPDAIE